MTEHTKEQKLDALGRLVGILSEDEYRRRIAEIHGFDLPEPGPCGDPSCPVLHADPAHPIHPPMDADGHNCNGYGCPTCTANG